MKLLYLILIVLFFIPLLLINTISPQEEKEDDIWSEERAMMAGGELIGGIEVAEQEAIQLLMNEATLDQRPQGIYYAMEFLEVIRSIKAVPILCDRLLYEQKVKKYNDVVGARLKCPATVALVSIGMPAVDGLLKKIATSNTTRRYRIVAMDILKDILGKEKVTRTIAEFQVEKNRENEDLHKKRLENLKKEFNKRYELEDEDKK